MFDLFLIGNTKTLFKNLKQIISVFALLSRKKTKNISDIFKYQSDGHSERTR